ncbi:hypothetical protein FGU65_05090 [Methanoculleus sp. FWC-SCC1]|uniref:DUF4935 domain-containing protein n=1 Tax=Methanoculleus frigidifontis TaxID=2584085 RepID=A0ABT8M8M4_9EURY|nr:PIN domain-containing protein [Methanoculleus sp. FWC-SCC1]MDN7024271.1 hypothetical protein [Methanoculleus sp. FWC-SCC1]
MTMRICIDTNLFLGLYWSDEDVREVFGDIEMLKRSLLVPDMISDEFLRNRDRILDSQSRQMRRTEIDDLHPPFLVRQQQGFSTLRERSDDYNTALQSLVAGIREMIADPQKDPLYVSFSGLIDDPAVTVIRRTEEHVERAHRRKLLGNPPKSERKDTIGDEVIWEMILGQADGDLLLITRDATYRNHITFLTAEYAEKTGHRLTIDGNISTALRAIGKEPSEPLLRFESRQTEAGE